MVTVLGDQAVNRKATVKDGLGSRVCFCFQLGADYVFVDLVGGSLEVRANLGGGTGVLIGSLFPVTNTGWTMMQLQL